MNLTEKWLLLRYGGQMSRDFVDLATWSNYIWNEQRKRTDRIKEMYDLVCVISGKRGVKILKPKVNMSIEEMN